MSANTDLPHAIMRKILDPDVVVHGNELAAAILSVLTLHRAHRIFDECDHHHQYTDEGKVPEGVLEIEEVGLTCEAGFMYSICWSCCTQESGYQSEGCADNHDHRGGPESCWPCPTVQAMAKDLHVADAAVSS